MLGIELDRDVAERLSVRLPRKHCTATLKVVAGAAVDKDGTDQARILGKETNVAMASAIEDLLDFEDDRCLFCSWSALKTFVAVLFTISLLCLIVGGAYAMYFPAISTYGQRDMALIMKDYEAELRSRWAGNESKLDIDKYIDPHVGRVMFVGDPQIEGDGRIKREGLYGRLNVWFNDVYMWWVFRRNLAFFNPDVVIVVGDLVSSQYINFKEFQSRAMRLKSMFHLPPGHEEVEMIYLVGNHDIGYGMDITVERVSRFERMFGPTNAYHEFLGHRWLIYDAQQLDGSRIADYQRKTWLHLEKYGRNETLKESKKPLILLGHIPLFKDINKACSDHYHIERTGRGWVQTQTMLTKESSDVLLSYHPILAFSGHDHNGCFAEHPWTHSKSPLLPDVIDVSTLGHRGRLIVNDDEDEVMQVEATEIEDREGRVDDAEDDAGTTDVLEEEKEEDIILEDADILAVDSDDVEEEVIEDVQEIVESGLGMGEEVEKEALVEEVEEEEREVERDEVVDNVDTAESGDSGEVVDVKDQQEDDEEEETAEEKAEEERSEEENGETEEMKEKMKEEKVKEEGTCYEMTVRSIMGDFGGHMVLMEMQQYKEVAVADPKWQYAMTHTRFGDTPLIVLCILIVVLGFVAVILLYVLSCCRVTSRDRVQREKRRLARKSAARKKAQ